MNNLNEQIIVGYRAEDFDFDYTFSPYVPLVQTSIIYFDDFDVTSYEEEVDWVKEGF